ncbi:MULTISPECIES: hypothetical protein [Rhizobium/Agrobacterium group]|nr:hypothetical protein [Rhizobium ruizarguesonis]
MHMDLHGASLLLETPLLMDNRAANSAGSLASWVGVTGDNSA